MKPHHRTDDTHKSNVRVTLRVCVAVAGCALMFGIIACDVASPQSDTEKPDTKEPAVDDRFVGDYHATSGNTVIGLKITRDRFTALIVTGGGEVAPTRADSRMDPVRRASAHGNAIRATAAEQETIIVSGTVAAIARTVTATIKEVKRNGQALTGDELGRYTSCSISATIGAGFAREAVTAILDCLRVPTDAGVSSIEREPPETSIVGTWDIDLSDWFALHLAELYTFSIDVSSTDLDISVGETLCGANEPRAMQGPAPAPGEAPPLSLSFDSVVPSLGSGYQHIADEGEPIEFVVSLSPPANETVTVDWATVGQQGDYIANAGFDYTAARGTLTFSRGDSSQTFTVMTIDDSAVEGFKYFRVQLTNAQGAYIAEEFASGTIIDDEDDRLCVRYDLHYDVDAIDGTNISLMFQNGEFRNGLNEDVVPFDRSNFLGYGGFPLPPDVSLDDLLDFDVSFVVVEWTHRDVALFRFEGLIPIPIPQGVFLEVVGYRQP